MTAPLKLRRWRPRFSLLTLLIASIFCGSCTLLWLHREPWQVWCVIQEGAYVMNAGYSASDAYFYTVTSTPWDGPSEKFQVTIKTYSNETGRLKATIVGPMGHTFFLGHDLVPEKFLCTQSSEKNDATNYDIKDYRGHIWDADTGVALQSEEFKPADLYMHGISPRGNFAVVTSKHVSDRMVKLPSFEKVADLRQKGCVLITGEFSPDEKWFSSVVCGDCPKKVCLFPTEPGAAVQTIGPPKPELHTNFSPDSRGIAICTNVDGAPKTGIYDIQTHELKAEFSGMFCTFSDDSNYMLTAKELFPNGASTTVTAWNIASGTSQQFQTKYPHATKIANKRVLVKIPFGVWDAETGAAIFSKQGSGEFSPDGRFMYFLGQTGYSLRNTSGGIIHEFDLSDPSVNVRFANRHAECMTYIALHKPIAGSNRTGETRLWRRRRPEFWYGFAWLWEFWLVVGLFGALVWSIVRRVEKQDSLHMPTAH